MSAPLPAAASAKPAPAARAPADVLRVVLAYAVFASLWILLSDTVVGWLFSDPAQIVRVSTIKGWLFVVVTTLLLYGLIRRLRDQALAGAREELAAQAEKARALQLLAAIADNSSDAIFAKDREGRYLLANRSVERIVGKTAEQMLGQDDTVLFPQQAETIRANDRRVMDENRINTYEETIATAEGERTFLATKGPLHDAQGQVTGMFGISRDITEHHQAAMLLRQHAEALRESEARYHSLFDNSHAAMLLIDSDGGAIVAANPAAAAFYGWTQEQLQGMRIDQINDLPPAEVAAEMQRAQAQQRNSFEFRHRLADGQVRDVEVFSSPVQIGGRAVLYSIVHDISGRKQAARRLAESEARREAEMSAALEAQQQGRLAALNLMDDALTARASAEEALAALARLSRLYATLNQSNQAIVRCDSEDALFPQICRDTVNFGGLKMAWIGLVDPTGQKIMPMAAFGDATDYLANALISMDAENPRGQDPTATAIRDSRPVWCQDFLHDPHTAPWHECGARAGWMASAALPLCRKGVTVGALTLYAGDANFFDEAIRKLLIEMAADISFAMDSYALVAERTRAEAKMTDQIDELRRWQQVTLGREGRVLAMKKEVNSLLAERGQPPRYPSAADAATET